MNCKLIEFRYSFKFFRIFFFCFGKTLTEISFDRSCLKLKVSRPNKNAINQTINTSNPLLEGVKG